MNKATGAKSWPPKEIARLLSLSTLLSSVPAAALGGVAARCVLRALRRGETLCVDPRCGDRAWLIVSGLLRVDFCCDGGLPALIDLLAAGSFFGDFYGPRTTAVTDAMLIGIPNADLRGLLRKHDGVAAAAIALLLDGLRQSAWLRAAARCSAPERVAGVLLWLRSKLGDELPLSRAELADAAMVTRETCIRCLSPLEKKGWIRTRRGLVAILNPRRLEESTPCRPRVMA